MPTRRSEGRRRRSNSTGEGSSRKGIEKTPDGFCTKVYPSGDRYEGSYFDGKRAGWGYYLWSSGDKFVGNWLAGVMHGSGTFTWATGDVYKGEWEMGKATGLGLKVTTDGTNIEGQFVDGLAQGWARKSFKFGDTYCGLCSSGLREGYGEYTWQSGDRFAGLWRNDVAVGPGVFSLCRRVPSGSSEVMEYSGEYKNGNRHGRGTATFTDGSKYSGDWANGKCHGWGRSTWSSLATEDVVAASAVLSGRGRRAGRFASSSARMALFEAPPVGASTAGDQTDGDVTGELYEGDFVDGIRDGQGYQEKIHVISDPSNGVVQCYIETYSGQWRNEAWWGWGVLCTADGETYRGQFVSGARHGYGEQVNEAAPRSPENPKCGMWNNNSFSHSAPPP